MKRISQLQEKSIKQLKLWNYRTIIMFLIISIIIFLLLLLVGGCKIDTAEYMLGKPFATLTTFNLTVFPPPKTAVCVVEFHFLIGSI